MGSLAAASNHGHVRLRHRISSSHRVSRIIGYARPRRRRGRRKLRPPKRSNWKAIGKSVDDDAGATGTERGIQAGGRFEFREKRKPRHRRLKRQRIARLQLPADEIAVMRARIASAFDLMRRAAEGDLVQFYAAKLAGLSLCLRPDEVPAAADRLRSERDAALEMLRATWRERERVQIRESVDMLVRARQATRYRWRSQRHAGLLWGTVFSEAAREINRRRPWQLIPKGVRRSISKAGACPSLEVRRRRALSFCSTQRHQFLCEHPAHNYGFARRDAVLSEP